MKKSELFDLIRTRREIEFVFDDKAYSITYSRDNDGKINFCEFYQENQQFASAEELFENAMVGDEALKNIWKWVTDITVY